MQMPDNYNSYVKVRKRCLNIQSLQNVLLITQYSILSIQFHAECMGETAVDSLNTEVYNVLQSNHQAVVYIAMESAIHLPTCRQCHQG